MIPVAELTPDTELFDGVKGVLCAIIDGHDLADELPIDFPGDTARRERIRQNDLADDLARTVVEMMENHGGS